MQVNTKEILLHPPPKGLANCAMWHGLTPPLPRATPQHSTHQGVFSEQEQEVKVNAILSFK